MSESILALPICGRTLHNLSLCGEGDPGDRDHHKDQLADCQSRVRFVVLLRDNFSSPYLERRPGWTSAKRSDISGAVTATRKFRLREVVMRHTPAVAWSRLNLSRKKMCITPWKAQRRRGCRCAHDHFGTKAQGDALALTYVNGCLSRDGFLLVNGCELLVS